MSKQRVQHPSFLTITEASWPYCHRSYNSLPHCFSRSLPTSPFTFWPWVELLIRQCYLQPSKSCMNNGPDFPLFYTTEFSLWSSIIEDSGVTIVQMRRKSQWMNSGAQHLNHVSIGWMQEDIRPLRTRGCRACSFDYFNTNSQRQWEVANGCF